MTIALDTLLPAGAWSVDPDSSSVGFSVRHFGFAKVRGTFRVIACHVDVNGAVAIDGSVAAGSVDTGDAVRDARLAEEFFDASSHPQISFRSSRVERGPGAVWLVTGELTIRGHAREVVLRVVEDRVSGDEVRLLATATLSRAAFGLDWPALRKAGRLLVSDEVELTADTVAVRRRP